MKGILPVSDKTVLTSETRNPDGSTLRTYKHGRVTVIAKSIPPSPEAIRRFNATLHEILGRLVDQEAEQSHPTRTTA